MILAKDFVETAEGLIFAVVESGQEDGKALCFLRYIKKDSGWTKVNTEQANAFLLENYPQYIYFSPLKQASIHGVDIKHIVKHHRPQQRLQDLIHTKVYDDVEKDLSAFCHLLKNKGLSLERIGVTGSILIAAQNAQSDIDLVFYNKHDFDLARLIIEQLIAEGSLQSLTEQDWSNSYQRRDCALSYADYVWHEQRKMNKAIINQRKVDLSYVSTEIPVNDLIHYKKLSKIKLKVQVSDDWAAFDYPAQFTIDHPQIQAIVSYTATYTGQAKKGEWIDVAGIVEQAENGCQRIVVGSSREAAGEYIKVIHG